MARQLGLKDVRLDDDGVKAAFLRLIESHPPEGAADSFCRTLGEIMLAGSDMDKERYSETELKDFFKKTLKPGDSSILRLLADDSKLSQPGEIKKLIEEMNSLR